jgi:hypothetical protein
MFLIWAARARFCFGAWLLTCALGLNAASLHPTAKVVGKPWTGATGVRETTAQIAKRAQQSAGRPSARRVFPFRRIPPAPPAPGGPALSVVVPSSSLSAGATVRPLLSQTLGVNFTGATLADASGYPPDSMGAAGPSQFVVAINGRLRSFNKNTGVADGVLNVDFDTFFNSVMTPPANNNFTSDPHIRYDRLSGRWFIVIIDVPGMQGTQTNRVLLAMSDSGTITGGTVWTFFQFPGDSANFADFPTLGIDANALYIGANIFSVSSGQFANTSAFVVRKSSLLAGGPIVVTPFTGLITGKGPFRRSGPFTPQGVDNYDPAATEGYFIGVDINSTTTLQLLRVTDPGGTPVLSAGVPITVSQFADPILVPHLGNTGGGSGQLDGGDRRLLCAHLRNGELWTAQNIGVNNTGSSTGTITRDAVRWYALTNIPTGHTPAVAQSGTVYQASTSNSTDQRSYWMGTIMVSGQGHVAMGFSTAGATNHIDAAVTGRLAGDPANTMDPPTRYTASGTAYNPPGDPGGTYGRRWGDYSYTCLDPSDDMTMWTIQEFCNAANSYAVQVVRMLAPAPAQPASCTPSNLSQGDANVLVTLTGTSTSGSGFFDPGTGFSNRLVAVVNGGGVTVNSVAFNNPTNLTLDLTVAADAASVPRTVTVTNPDGQSATSLSGLLTISGGAVSNHPPVLTPVADRTIHARMTLVVTNAATDPDSGDTLTFDLEPGAPGGATIGATNGVFVWTPTDGQVGTNLVTVRVMDNGVPPLSATNDFTVMVEPRPFQTVSITNDVLTLQWSAIAGVAYRAQYSTNLANGIWTDVIPDVLATGPVAGLTNVLSADESRFYRLIVVP